VTDNQYDGQSYKQRYLFYNNMSNICLIKLIIKKAAKISSYRYDFDIYCGCG